MNRFTVHAIFIFFGATLTLPAFAQARHDEKPHGMMTTAQEAAQAKHMAANGGRHDEGATTHGYKKPQVTSEESRKSDKPSDK